MRATSDDMELDQQLSGSSSSSSEPANKITHIVGGRPVCVAVEDDVQCRGELRDVETRESQYGENSVE